MRTVLFVSGCRNHCKDCFQPETWAFEYGNPFTGEVEDEIIASLKPDYIRGLTLLGGDPFEPENQKALLPFMRRVPGGKCCTADTAELLHTIDVLVDGPFVTELHDISLLFKGSSNQRVIDCAEYCRSGEIRELM